MSGRIEIYNSTKEPTSKWSKNEAFSIKDAGVDIEKDVVDKEGCYIDDTAPASDTTYSSRKIENVAKAIVNDETSSTTTTYSSAKIDELIASIPAGGGRSFTNVTYNPISNNGINTIVTVEKEED